MNYWILHAKYCIPTIYFLFLILIRPSNIASAHISTGFPPWSPVEAMHALPVWDHHSQCQFALNSHNLHQYLLLRNTMFPFCNLPYWTSAHVKFAFSKWADDCNASKMHCPYMSSFHTKLDTIHWVYIQRKKAPKECFHSFDTFVDVIIANFILQCKNFLSLFCPFFQQYILPKYYFPNS